MEAEEIRRNTQEQRREEKSELVYDQLIIIMFMLTCTIIHINTEKVVQLSRFCHSVTFLLFDANNNGSLFAILRSKLGNQQSQQKEVHRCIRSQTLIVKGKRPTSY